MPIRKSSQGFTLVELLIVVVLLAIFASIAIPSFSTTIKNNRLQSAASELQALLLSARTDAVTKRSAVTVSQNADNSWQAVQGGVTINNIAIPEDIAVAPTVKVITFQPDGTATASSIGVTNSEESALYTVSVTLPGQVKNVKTTPTSSEGGK